MPARKRNDLDEPGRGRGICIVPGDPQVVDIVVASGLPAKTAAGTPASSFFGDARAGFLVPLGSYAGASYSRSGRAPGTSADIAAIPLTHGVPIAMSGRREVYLRRSGVITAAGTLSLVYYPVADEEDLDDPYLFSAIATFAGGGGGGSVDLSQYFPLATALADTDPNPTTTRVGANLLAFNGTTWDRVSVGGAGLGNVRVVPHNGTVGAEIVASNIDAQGTKVGLATNSYPYGFNGATYDRLRSSGYQTAQDNFIVPTLGLSHTLAFAEVLNNRTLTADRLRQPDAYAEAGASVQAVSTATTGVKLSVTCPASATLRIRSATAYHLATAGTVVVELQLTPSAGVATVIQRWILVLAAGNVAGGDSELNIRMTPGDVLEWTVKVAVAATSFDFTVSYEQSRYVI